MLTLSKSFGSRRDPEPRWAILQYPRLVAVAWTPSAIELPDWTRSLDDLIEPASTHLLR